MKESPVLLWAVSHTGTLMLNTVAESATEAKDKFMAGWPSAWVLPWPSYAEVGYRVVKITATVAE